MSFYNINESLMLILPLMKDNFAKQFIIILFYTTLVAFISICEIARMTYNLARRSNDLNLIPNMEDKDTN